MSDSRKQINNINYFFYKNFKDKGSLNFFYGQSGSGKTYLIENLLNAYPNEFTRPHCITTRVLRPTDNSKYITRVNKEDFFKHNLSNYTKIGNTLNGTLKLKNDNHKAYLQEVKFDCFKEFSEVFIKDGFLPRNIRFFHIKPTKVRTSAELEAMGRGERAKQEFIDYELNHIKKLEKTRHLLNSGVNCYIINIDKNFNYSIEEG